MNGSCVHEKCWALDNISFFQTSPLLPSSTVLPVDENQVGKLTACVLHFQFICAMY